MPKLSIITVNLNNAEGLKKTIDSVASQTFNNYEHLIIDGGSMDGSVEIIKKYEQCYKGLANSLFWESEPDTGIYNAMNKGIRIAKGDYLQFLNSGDTLYDENTFELIEVNIANSGIIYGNTLWGNQLILNEIKTFNNLFESNICHQSSFIKVELLKKNIYPEKYKIAADYYFFLLMALKGEKFKYINHPISKIEKNGYSMTNWKENHIERNLIQQDLIPELILKDYHCNRKVRDHINSKIYDALTHYKTNKISFKIIFRIFRFFALRIVK